MAITIETYTARRAYQIADHYRRRASRRVRRHHPSFLPDEALAHADAVVIGDAEPVWGEVVRDARSGRMKSIYRADGQPPLDGLVFDRSIFSGLRYPKMAAVQVGEGAATRATLLNPRVLRFSREASPRR